MSPIFCWPSWPRLSSCSLPCFPLTRFIFLRGPELPEPTDVQLHPPWPLYLHLLPGLLRQQLPVRCVRLCLDQPGVGTALRGTGQEWANGCKGSVLVIGTAETGGWHVQSSHGAASREHLCVELLDRAGASSRIPRTEGIPAPNWTSPAQAPHSPQVGPACPAPACPTRARTQAAVWRPSRAMSVSARRATLDRTVETVSTAKGT